MSRLTVCRSSALLTVTKPARIPVINPDRIVDFLTIEHEDFVSVKAIPFKIIGIGEYAVTVESENAVI